MHWTQSKVSLPKALKATILLLALVIAATAQSFEAFSGPRYLQAVNEASSAVESGRFREAVELSRKAHRIGRQEWREQPNHSTKVSFWQARFVMGLAFQKLEMCDMAIQLLEGVVEEVPVKSRTGIQNLIDGCKPQSLSKRVFFWRNIEPILIQKCGTCHGLGGDSKIKLQTAVDFGGWTGQVKFYLTIGIVDPLNHPDLTLGERNIVMAWLRGERR
ncbi:MAG: hypothetical protein NTY38_22175 [Acidobacteria bacterium]|nr:hypothetical protein [Acidobacteriota bacterium]